VNNANGRRAAGTSPGLPDSCEHMSNPDHPTTEAVDAPYDGVLLVSFGGPEKREDVLPFLENVVHGRNVPRERLLEVARHYERFGGASPLNAQNRALIAALEAELADHGPRLSVYWGNRNWHPVLTDTMRQMAEEGRRRVLAFVTSAFSSYSSCRQYLEDIAAARESVGSSAPRVDKLRAFHNHAGFIEPMAERVLSALAELPPDHRASAKIVYTAHSIPQTMAAGCRYQAQLTEACRLVGERTGRRDGTLVFQSRSGRPGERWLEPDICDHLNHLAGEQDSCDVVVVPIGFLSDHMEVVYDLDVEARELCESLGINMVRAGTVGCNKRFVQMIRELIWERIDPGAPKLALGESGPSHDECAPDCCPRATTGERPA